MPLPLRDAHHALEPDRHDAPPRCSLNQLASAYRVELRQDRPLRCLDQLVDVVVGVRVRDVVPLEVGRQLEDPALDQTPAVADVQVGVVAQQVVVRPDGPATGSSSPRPSRSPVTNASTPMRSNIACELRAHALAEPEDVLVDGLALELLDRRERRRSRSRDARCTCRRASPGRPGRSRTAPAGRRGRRARRSGSRSPSPCPSRSDRA